MGGTPVGTVFVNMAPAPKKRPKKTAIERFREEAAKQGVQIEEVRGTAGSGEIFIRGPKPPVDRVLP